MKGWNLHSHQSCSIVEKQGIRQPKCLMHLKATSWKIIILSAYKYRYQLLMVMKALSETFTIILRQASNVGFILPELHMQRVVR